MLVMTVVTGAVLIEAARRVSLSKVPVTCVGLQPRLGKAD